jgi:hypothetical protein
MTREVALTTVLCHRCDDVTGAMFDDNNPGMQIPTQCAQLLVRGP